jgi:hypothetical protein
MDWRWAISAILVSWGPGHWDASSKMARKAYFCPWVMSMRVVGWWDPGKLRRGAMPFCFKEGRPLCQRPGAGGVPAAGFDMGLRARLYPKKIIDLDPLALFASDARPAANRLWINKHQVERQGAGRWKSYATS